MATKTNIEVKTVLHCGRIVVHPGRYVLEDHAACADLKADIDAGQKYIEVLGTFDDEATATAAATTGTATAATTTTGKRTPKA